ncbi:DUF3027 domain-containing protein [Corynebacterium cystitidis]|uniref:DUF3027 domain-containing protein n=1 Tax=Corynebacterium cystitidis DSM 20524 TaxID=1121357 RepID=A0A1H9WH57_9CORY|nr:hypothetical protein CCYS_04620 [Corynebacterium cystitidis DSM 20524]SES33151.1 Protein of unknown function [Corynebacterium cystitidis DSM 20524]SNV82599.1 Protein of uncharacterised function (DUF3027) [Corynebacterium cystitidis]
MHPSCQGLSHNRVVYHPNNRNKSNPLLTPKAISVAREALVDVADGEEIGDHIGTTGLAHNVAVHRFHADVPGYPGWEWNAVVACAAGSRYVTVNEVALVPAPEGQALQAPEWVPYSDRLRPGDLGPGDIIAPAPDDERLTADSFARDAVTFTGRETKKYLTTTGLKDAKQRWRTGEFGPTSDFAEKAALRCATCAFYVPMGQPVGDIFGACTNEYSADGRVVASSYGCGAHSDTTVEETGIDEAEKLYDDERPIF